MSNDKDKLIVEPNLGDGDSSVNGVKLKDGTAEVGVAVGDDGLAIEAEVQGSGLSATAGLTVDEDGNIREVSLGADIPSAPNSGNEGNGKNNSGNDGKSRSSKIGLLFDNGEFTGFNFSLEKLEPNLIKMKLKIKYQVVHRSVY